MYNMIRMKYCCTHSDLLLLSLVHQLQIDGSHISFHHALPVRSAISPVWSLENARVYHLTIHSRSLLEHLSLLILTCSSSSLPHWKHLPSNSLFPQAFIWNLVRCVLIVHKSPLLWYHSRNASMMLSEFEFVSSDVTLQ